MITEETVTLRHQTPTPPNEWLFQSEMIEEQEVRTFSREVYLGKDSEPWHECTNAAKQQWEDEHQHESEQQDKPAK